MNGRGNPWNCSGIRKLHGGNKFAEAQDHLKASLQKHMKTEYESSSEEEELERENILDCVLKSYSPVGGKNEELGRTQQFLEDAFQSGATTCLICIASVKRADAVWNCVECFCLFHLPCIQRWARDSIIHQKEAVEDLSEHSSRTTSLKWSCPKCRHDYMESAIPQRYLCFCGQQEDPPYHPWLVPHSCGETCGRDLQPLCGHVCLLLCHPGPCPPCPKTVKNTCHCKKQPARPQRCSNKTWSCGNQCGHILQCGRHKCNEICHSGDCLPCPKTSVQSCLCGSQRILRPCADPSWKCTEVCNKQLNCGHHLCEIVCHSGECGKCPLLGPRFCPCGKASFKLPCTQDTIPTCGDTCGHLLECGIHKCSRPCHREKCGACLEVAVKKCRCGMHEKEQPCKKEYLCDIKCKRVKNCSRHPCNRKCCDGNCPPCEKPCGRTLTCGIHKCASICHRGPCYPCPATEVVKCHCGQTMLVVPCGRKKKTKPPRCTKLCSVKPKCHHPSSEPHRCHFGDCPPCHQMCNKIQKCGHKCSVECHSAVWVQVSSSHKPAGPWERVAPQIELQALQCPDCKVPVPVTCLGGHVTEEWPCWNANATSCQRECGRKLACENHVCTFPCHLVEGATNDDAGTNCEVCEAGCSKPRPKGCTHQCLKPCHPGPCPPCNQLLRIQCHCNLSQLYVHCGEWNEADDETAKLMQSCGNQCPKNLECGHRCRLPCHPGECPVTEVCRKKVKLACPCRRLRKEFPCGIVKAGGAKVICDEACKAKKEEEYKIHEQKLQQKKEEEERRNQEEMERFQRKFQARRKQRERRQQEEKQQPFFRQYWVYGCGVSVVLIAAYMLISKPLEDLN